MLLLAPAAVGTPAYTTGSEGVHSLSAVSSSTVTQFIELRFFYAHFFVLFLNSRFFFSCQSSLDCVDQTLMDL